MAPLKRVLDTNIVLHYLAQTKMPPLLPGEYYVSVITELELLSFSRITPEEERAIKTFIGDINVVGLLPDVFDATIRLRRKYRLNLPDAIISATALVLEAELLTNDTSLRNIDELRVTSIPIE